MQNMPKAINLLGFWASLIITVLGAFYFITVIVMLATGNFILPPPEYAQNIGAAVDLLVCLLTVMLFASIQYSVPHEKKIFSHLGLIFASIFAIMVSINRFIQISIVRLSIIEGDFEGLKRLLPYDSRSAMFALEIIGYGFFLSLAVLFISASIINDKKLKPVRITFMVYVVLGFISVIGFIFNSLIINVGFVAWGLVLYIGTGMLAFNFYKNLKLGNLKTI